MYLILIGYETQHNVPMEARRRDLNHQTVLDVSAWHPRQVYAYLKEELAAIYDDSADDWAIVLWSANPHLFNAVGTLIANGNIHYDEWNILVSYYGANYEQSVINTTYDKEGFLINWPYGAFHFLID